MTENPGDLLSWVNNVPTGVQVANSAAFSSLTVAGTVVSTASRVVTPGHTPVGFFVSPDGAGNETTNTSMNSRSLYFAPTNSAVTDIVVAFPGSSFNGPEVDNPASFTVNSAIEYPSGTFTPVYTNGSRTLTVNAGRTITKFDPCPSLYIPAGAQYWVKCWANWTTGFWDNSLGNVLAGNTTKYGIGLADQTLTTISGGSGGISGGGFTPYVYGRVSSPVVLGILGTSHDRGSGDVPDVFTGAIGWARAIRGVFPVMTYAKVGLTAAQYLSRSDGAQIAFREAITHLLVDLTTNDIFVLSSNLATLQANLLAIISPFLLRGVKVYSMTVTPRSTSTDVWMTAANQTVSSSASETVRLAFNAWLRANWQAIGLSGIFDIARVIDPGDTGLWSVDPGAQASTSVTEIQRGWCTMSATGSVSSMPIAFGAANGALFGANTTVNCITRNYPGDTGSGAVIVGNTDGTGKITSWTVQNGGSGYQYPPLISPAARRTIDGTHLTSGCYDYVISTLGIGPNSFA